MSSVVVEDQMIEKKLEPFYGVENLVGLRFHHRAQFTHRKVHGDECLVIADNEMSYLCLSLADGKVWFTDDENEPQFVNSSFDLFVECASKHKEFFNFNGNEDARIYAAARALKEFIGSIDAPALQENAFWSLIIEELEMLHAPDEGAQAA